MDWRKLFIFAYIGLSWVRGFSLLKDTEMDSRFFFGATVVMAPLWYPFFEIGNFARPDGYRTYHPGCGHFHYDPPKW